MTATPLSALAVLAAYLIGAIPFGYLTARWLKGVDIRTIGSGNIGATNVGRAFGFRYFVLVFLFDVAKGLLPTLGLPRLIERLAGTPGPPALPVLLALAAILGHNYPVYLGFKGGKGVATSLGALTALDPWASLAAFAGFVGSLGINRYVSVSSLVGGLAFVVTHFARTPEPLSAGQLPMTLATAGLLVLLVVRHRGNLARLRQGTEPKVEFRKKKDRDGRVSVGVVVALAAAAGVAVAAYAFVEQATRPEVLKVGPYSLTEVARAATGHQRAERLAFADGGRLLAVTCPRYHRVVLYRVTDDRRLVLHRDLELAGKPVAVWPTPGRLLVLSRPPGDHRHIEPGWWEAFDHDGNPVGDRTRVGFYPDDFAVSPDGRFAYVLTSGKAEGEPDRPCPALDAFAIPEEGGPPRPAGRVTFDGPGDDPERLTLSASGTAAVVTLLGSNAVAAIDLFDPARPRLVGRSDLPRLELPYPSRFEEDRIVMPVASGSEGVLLPLAGVGECVAATLPKGSGLEIHLPARRRSLGTLTLRAGSIGLAKIRPLGLAYSADRGLLAVSNRSGSVHLVAIRPEDEGLARAETARALR